MANSTDSPFPPMNKFSFYSDDETEDCALFSGQDYGGFESVHHMNRQPGPFHEQSSSFFDNMPGPLFHSNVDFSPFDRDLREPSPYRSHPFSDDGGHFQEQQDPQIPYHQDNSPFLFTKPEPHYFCKPEISPSPPKVVHGCEPSFVAPPPMSATGSSSTHMDTSLISDHWTDTSPIRTERGDRMDDLCDADKYLHNGLEDIDQALQYHFAGRQFPRHVSKRAKELFKRSYELQSQQKDGDVAFRRNRGDSSSRRKRFARRKAFVVTAIVVSLKEFGLSLNGRMRQSDSQAIAALSETVSGGSKIRLTSVKSCCRTLSLTDIRFR